MKSFIMCTHLHIEWVKRKMESENRLVTMKFPCTSPILTCTVFSS